MYARRIKSNTQTWNLVLQRGKYSCSSNCPEYSSYGSSSCIQTAGKFNSRGILIRRYVLELVYPPSVASERLCTVLHEKSPVSLRCGSYRFYRSKGDGRNASEDKPHASVKDGAANPDKGKIQKGKKIANDVRHNAHARLGEEDQKEWLHNEKLAIESKKESPFLPRRDRYKNEFLRLIVPWEKITVSWDTFPYYIHDHTKSLLVECAASHLKHAKSTKDFGGSLTSSSGRILLQSVPGTELYRERLVRALARELRVPLLVLDSSVLAPFDFSELYSSETESDDENGDSGEECTSESEVEDENDATNEDEWTSSGEAKAESSDDDEVDLQASAEALKKLVPYNLEEFEKGVSGESESVTESSQSDANEHSDKCKQPFKKDFGCC